MKYKAIREVICVIDSKVLYPKRLVEWKKEKEYDLENQVKLSLEK